MTVKELIDKLKTVNGPTRVALDIDGEVTEIDHIDIEGDEDGIYIVGEDSGEYDGDEE